MTTKHLVPLMGAAAIAASIAWAPLAAAAPNQPNEICRAPGQGSTVCESPGDVEIKDTPPPVTFFPYGSPPPTAG